MSGSACHEKMRLLIAYQRGTVAHADAFSNMVVMDIPKDELQRLSAAAEKARKAAHDARDELERHIAQHGC